MSKEITVILKEPEKSPLSPTGKIWKVVNDIVKAPIFVFIFGAGIGALLPVIKDLATPSSEKERIRFETQVRADAQLASLFLANLNANEPGKFLASKAALAKLQEVSTGPDKKISPMFQAINRAIEAVAIEIAPKPQSHDLSTASREKKANIDTLNRSDIETAIAELQTAFVVYIQLSKHDSSKDKIAIDLQNKLRANSIPAPGIEHLDSDKIPLNTQVRFYHEIDRSRAEALAKILKSVGNISEVYLVRLDLPARPGVLEVWLGK